MQGNGPRSTQLGRKRPCLWCVHRARKSEGTRHQRARRLPYAPVVAAPQSRATLRARPLTLPSMMQLGLNVVFRKAAILLSTVVIKSDSQGFEVPFCTPFFRCMPLTVPGALAHDLQSTHTRMPNARARMRSVPCPPSDAHDRALEKHARTHARTHASTHASKHARTHPAGCTSESSSLSKLLRLGCPPLAPSIDMYVHMSAHMPIHMRMHMSIYRPIPMSTRRSCACAQFIRTYMRTYIHAYIHTCMHYIALHYMHACIHTYIHAFMHACMLPPCLYPGPVYDPMSESWLARQACLL